jgi:uncharacterized membrane protein
MADPLIKNDVVVFGLLAFLLYLIFKTASSNRRFFKKFYSVVPVLLLCYFIPGIFNSVGVISGEKSQLYPVAIQYLLPASLVLFTISLDLKEIWKLRRLAGLMFITGTVGVIIGGPIALYVVSLFSPGILGGSGPEETWRGLSTIAGSWIGGSANQAAMFEIFKPDSHLFSAMIAVDVIVANIWLGLLLYGAGISSKIDRFLHADNSALERLKNKMHERQQDTLRIPAMEDTIKIIGITFGIVGLSEWLAEIISKAISIHAPFLESFSLTSEFLWLVLLATLGGILLSFTKARNLEAVGASRLGSVLLYILIAIIGMKMNIVAILQYPALFVVALIWICIHGLLMLLVARLAKAPFFFLAVGSQANIGGAASAPIVASAFNPVLAPVGVLLAVFGYAIGTYGAYICGLIMQWISS